VVKIKLKSDFLDYYDHWFAPNFDSADYKFERLSTSPNMGKRHQFAILDEVARTPRHGVIRDMVKDWGNIYLGWVVVYHDEFAHRGEGKELLRFYDALQKYPDKYASHFWFDVRSDEGKAVSTRELQIGNRCWELCYTGYGPGVWRSNNAPTVTVEVVKEIRPWTSEVLKQYPLFAIDFVHVKAVDFNTAPQIKGTGLENILTSLECYQLIEKALVNSEEL
jgi:hypothetical protein